MIGEKDMKFFLFLRFIPSIVIAGMLVSCATGPPTVNERSDVQSGKKSVVLLRITCELLKDGTPIEAFPQSFFGGDPIIIGKGGPIIGGKLKFITSTRFLSSETRKQGWVYFYLEPGIHYLIFEGLKSYWARFYSPRYKVSMPKNSPVVYIGSLHLYCESPYFFGKSCGTFDKGRMVVSNEEDKAKLLLKEYLSDLGSIQIVLMERLYISQQLIL